MIAAERAALMRRITRDRARDAAAQRVRDDARAKMAQIYYMLYFFIATL